MGRTGEGKEREVIIREEKEWRKRLRKGREVIVSGEREWRKG